MQIKRTCMIFFVDDLLIFPPPFYSSFMPEGLKDITAVAPKQQQGCGC